jgi:hypothetical protein
VVFLVMAVAGFYLQRRARRTEADFGPDPTDRS